jgi:hypothetical protein
VMRRKCLTPPASVEVSIGTKPNRETRRACRTSVARTPSRRGHGRRVVETEPEHEPRGRRLRGQSVTAS